MLSKNDVRLEFLHDLLMVKSFNEAKILVMNKINSLKLSVKITLIYATMLIVVLIFISALTTAGVYMSFYHQAQLALESSISHTMEKINRGDPLDSSFWAGDPITQGVVLRVTDVNGGTLIENDPQFPAVSEMMTHIRKYPPLWADSNFKLIETHKAMLYYKRITLERGGQIFYLNFFRTITLEKQFLRYLLIILFTVNIVGIILALIIGYIVSSKVLKPIRDVTKTAKSIEVNNMNERLELSKSQDEVTELADTFNHMLDRLQNSFKQQQQFISDASHELRTPITVILGYSDMLVRWGKDDEEILDEGITSIQSEANNMNHLVENLLFLARADQNQQRLIKTPTELSAVIDKVTERVKFKENKNIDVLINDNGEIFADRDTIEKMLMIFIDNGIKYSGKDGNVKIYSRRKDKFMEVSIEDNGIGIAKEHQEKIFERFYKIDNSRTKLSEGISSVGLGLSIAKWIADQHDIKIEIESELDKGSKFMLTIPLAKDKLSDDDDSANKSEVKLETAEELNPISLKIKLN